MQCFQGLSAFLEFLRSQSVIWTRNKHATGCATPRYIPPFCNSGIITNIKVFVNI